MNKLVIGLGRIVLPKKARLRILRWTRRPGVGRVDFGQLRSLEPISRTWGADRGQPVDRYYIEEFLNGHSSDIRGRVLEVGDRAYTHRFGGSRASRIETVNAPPGTPDSTYVADFSSAPELPSDAFDCIICTQTLQLIPRVTAAVETLHRILRAGGVVLATVPGISPLYRDEEDRWQDHWRFTVSSARSIFGHFFKTECLEVVGHGNVLTSIAFLHGLAVEELMPTELACNDPSYELLITIRARKSRSI